MHAHQGLTNVKHTEKLRVFYLKVMDAKADSKDTMMQMLNDLHQQFITKENRHWLVVERDAKVYETFQSLKYEYGDELKWFIPYPETAWSMLENDQKALMKVYYMYDAGLKNIAKAAGYPVAAIQSCSQFTYFAGSMGSTLSSDAGEVHGIIRYYLLSADQSVNFRDN